MRSVIFAVCPLLLVACATGRQHYVPPSATAEPGANTKVIDKPRDAVWDSAIPELGKRFFVINNLDKASGLMNVSYGGDPEKYIDCGRIRSFVKNARGARSYEFPGARAHQQYEAMFKNGGASLLFGIERKMNLDGRVNLIFEEISPTKTRVTANTRYVVQRQQTLYPVGGGFPQNQTHTISFNSGGRASFPYNHEGRAAECAATGELEKELLSAVR